MPWKETDKMEQKKEFVLKSLDKRFNFTQLCREYGITTKTGYKWRERFLQRGYEGLLETSRKPKNNRNKIPEETIRKILKIKDKYRYWGAYKILIIFKRENPNLQAPCRGTVEELFKREGLVQKRRRTRKAEGERIQARVKADKPNKLWTVDFKGWWWTPLKERCEPLTVRDEYSKMILVIEAPERGDTPHVKAIFKRLFRKYGLPEYIRSDNGPPFANVLNLWGLTKLSVWWMSLGIKLDRDDPGCPYQNGGHERMHRDMMKELENKINGDITKHNKEFEKWRKVFNTIRPHEALGMRTPNEVYKRSERRYEEEDVEIEYGGRMKSRMVNDRGVVHFKGQRIFVGNPFAGYNVGIKQRPDDWSEVWFDTFKLGEINPDSGLIETEKYRIQQEVS
jgi:transposase InsO family protein